MSDHYIGANRGSIGLNDNNLTYGTSTGSTDLELRIADAKNITRQDIQLFLEALEGWFSGVSNIAGSKFPPF